MKGQKGHTFDSKMLEDIRNEIINKHLFRKKNYDKKRAKHLPNAQTIRNFFLDTWRNSLKEMRIIAPPVRRDLSRKQLIGMYLKLSKGKRKIQCKEFCQFYKVSSTKIYQTINFSELQRICSKIGK